MRRVGNLSAWGRDALVRYRSTVWDSNRWQPFSARAGDIIISTPPKCGTTWMQMICALLIFQRTTFDRSLDLISPWLEMQTRDIGDVIADLDAQPHRRFIKSHTPLDGLPYDEAVTYICVGRDPRDVAISLAAHLDNLDLEALFTARDSAVGNEDLAEMFRDWEPAPTDPVERFWRWVDEPNTGELAHVSLASTMHHLATFWEVRDQPNVVLVHYADLQRDLEGEMRRLADRLDIDIDDDRLADLAVAAGFDTMRERADELAPDASEGILQSNRAFFRSGRSGQWQQLLDDDGRRRYAERVKQLASTDLIEWAHRRTRRQPLSSGSQIERVSQVRSTRGRRCPFQGSAHRHRADDHALADQVLGNPAGVDHDIQVVLGDRAAASGRIDVHLYPARPVVTASTLATSSIDVPVLLQPYIAASPAALPRRRASFHTLTVWVPSVTRFSAAWSPP